MNLNLDFSKRIAIHSAGLDWVSTRMKGVKRRMLDRNGAESGRATSIVSYDENSHFSSHTHTGGEEFIVLDGVFQDEHGDFPTGSYIRNPPESSHTPGSNNGCVIFVKLWQFDLNDRTHVRIPKEQMKEVVDENRFGITITPLYQDTKEIVRIEHWQPNTTAPLITAGGAEILVLSGSFEENNEAFTKHSWLRLPDNARSTITSGKNGVTFWVKTGHLRYATSQLT